MIINFECQKCAREFNCDVGTVTVPEDSDRPNFENTLVCPFCGEVTMDEVWLTELGQSQLTEATLDIVPDFFGQPESAPCQGCDDYLPLNDIGFCEHCSAKMDRDFIRQRQWEYSPSAFCLDHDQREQLRKTIIKNTGRRTN